MSNQCLCKEDLPPLMKRNMRRIIGISLVLFLASIVSPSSLVSAEGEDTAGNGLVVSELPSSLAKIDDVFSKYVNVFNVSIVATSGVDDSRLLHSANILAQYLDTDADNVVDNSNVVDEMISNHAILIITVNADETDRVFEEMSDDALDSFIFQDLSADEMVLPGETGFDASLEEVLHLITSVGYASAYPSVWSHEGDTNLTQLTDNARGGTYETPPSQYSDEAWFHYDDETCDRGCNAVEYTYWALTSHLGGQESRCSQIADEWELCTASKLAETDPNMVDLMTEGEHALPLVLPDGSYQGQVPANTNVDNSGDGGEEVHDGHTDGMDDHNGDAHGDNELGDESGHHIPSIGFVFTSLIIGSVALVIRSDEE